MTPEQAQKTLEEIVDAFGLTVVCDMLGGICDEKAEHLRDEYNDQRSAKAWAEAARAFHATEIRVRDFDILSSRTRARRHT